MLLFESIKRNRHAGRHGFQFLLFALLVFSTGIAHGAQAPTVNEKYAGLASGILSSARLEPLDEGVLLVGDGVRITRAELMKSIDQEEPKLRGQLKKNLFFVMEQEAARRVLIHEAGKAGISNSGGDENQTIQKLFERKAADASVSEDELETFYRENREMIGTATFEHVKDSIRQYLLQARRNQAINAYIAGLSDTVHLRVDKGWVEIQSRLALDNPVDQARRSGRPTMVEFGAAGCAPCDMMQPIVDNLRKNYSDKLNVVFVPVREEQVLSARYGIRSIPVQAFFDSKGGEIFRHVGFFPESEILKQLARMGVSK
ncbi:MAG: thioredoxin family protein [Desulfobacterales bacterium]|nr:thioredoxin family protein [Desulfobacterales bacterium]